MKQAANTMLEIRKFYAGKRCLLTGHTGFQGSWLSLWLHSMGAGVIGYALDPEPHSLFEHASISELVKDTRADVRDKAALEKVFEQQRPEIVFHLAAQSLVRLSYDQPKDTFDTNIGGTVNLLDVIRMSDSVKAVVVVTSDKCYENREWPYPYREIDKLGGHDPYSASKGATEIVAHSFYRSFLAEKGIALATARAGNCLGGGDWSRDRLVPDVMNSLIAGTNVEIRNPDAVRPWQHLLDPLWGYLLLGYTLAVRDHTSDYCGAWNFGPGPDSIKSVRSVVERIIDIHGSGQWSDSSGKDYNPHEARLLAISSEKARSQLGWRPHFDFQTCLERTVRWYEQFNDGANCRGLCQADLAAFEEVVYRR